MVCLDYPEVTTSGQLKWSRDESLTVACWEFCMCSPVRGGKTGCGPVFGTAMEVLDVYHACCSQPAIRSHSFDSCGMAASHFFLSWAYVNIKLWELCEFSRILNNHDLDETGIYEISVITVRKAYKRASLPVFLNWAHPYRIFVYIFGLLCPCMYTKTAHYCSRVASRRPVGQLKCILYSCTVRPRISLKKFGQSCFSCWPYHICMLGNSSMGARTVIVWLGLVLRTLIDITAFFRPEPFSRLYIFGTKLREKKITKKTPCS